MKFPRFFSRPALGFSPALALLAVPLLMPVLGGCIFIKKPPTMAVPAPVPTPFGVQFDAAEGTPKGTALNNQEGAAPNPALPDAFRAALIVSGQELVLQSANKIVGSDGKPQVNLNAADTLNPVRLAGIIVPVGNQTGAQETIAVIQTWIAGQDLDVDIDPVFPTDVDNKRRVHIFFTARDEPYTGTRMSLNRMLVRSGYAIVDLHSPTSFDQRQWLYDETFARENELGLWKTDTFRALQQRVKLPLRGTAAKSRIGMRLPVPGQAPANPSALIIPNTDPVIAPGTTNLPAAAPSPLAPAGGN